MQFLKRYILLLIYLSIGAKSMLPLLDYTLNYEYIKQVLCINKEKPVLQCNGKCHLSAQIEKNTDTKKEEQRLKTELLVHLQQEILQLKTRIPSLEHAISIPYTNRYRMLFVVSLLRPPTVSFLF